MKCMTFFLPESFREKAKLHYDETMNDQNREVRDPVITPFAFEMQLLGYVVFPRHPRTCQESRECPRCKGKHSTRYQKNGAAFWGCPHCRTVMADECS